MRLLLMAGAALVVVASSAGCGGSSATTSTSRVLASSASTPAPVSSPSIAASSTAVASSSSAAQPGPTAATICTERAMGAVARFFGVAAASVSGRGATANSSYPVCAFEVHAAAARGVRLAAEVDTEPDPYGILGRTVDESAQAWPARTHPAPINVKHLGLAADWFPANQQLQTTDGVRMVIVTVGGRAPMQRKVSLAVAVARTFLGRLEPKLATGPAP